MLKVELISHTPQPEKLVAMSAKLCYSPCSINETGDKLTDENISSFVKSLAEMEHESPLEHISFTFGIEGVSRACLAQLTRHRIASYSVQSQRYVREAQFEYIIPPEIENCKEAAEEFITAMEEDQRHYDKISGILKQKYIKEFVESGMEMKMAQRSAEKKAIEDARFVLPNACETKIICTFNARSLINLFSHRCCNRAQWEIREMSMQMLRLVFKKAPNVFKNAGPSCIKGRCSEGKMSCGKINEMRNRIHEIMRDSM